MWKIEWKKLWFDQWGGILLLLFLAAYAVLCLVSGCDSTKAITQNEAAYLSYMQRWQGELNDQKVSELQAEYDALNHADSREAQDAKAAFMEVYNQYYYAKENPSRRFLMDERGWNTLLTHDGVNFLLVLCLLALCVPVFCGEYSCRMDQLLRSCRNGREALAKYKLLLMAVTAVIVTLLFQGVQFWIVGRTVDLSGLSYPLQSLSFFETSPYRLTIGQAYGLVVLCRVAGAVWFAVMTAFLSVWCRKTVLTLFAGISVSLLPHLLGNSFLKYVLPLPAGLLAGTGYLWGPLTEPHYNADYTEIRDVAIFRGVSPKEFCGLLSLFAAVLLVQLFFTVRRYVGRKAGAGVRIPICAVLLVWLSLFFLTGCSGETQAESVYDFFGNSDHGENGDYMIELDPMENTIYATNRKSGEAVLLNRSAFQSQGDIFAIYVTESTCYYAMQNTGGTGEGVWVYGVDLHDFSERLVYSSVPDNTADFWGLYE
ncbi:MAG: hypothetical protein J6B43_12225 [Lachnospiraceae bacterium]|nr:hypothetical protein [Lachnospiraceae bacterium]